MSTRRSPFNTEPQFKKDKVSITPSMPQSRFDRVSEIREIFRLFDQDNNEKISNSELGNFLRAIGRNPSQEEVDKLIEEVDKDKNGFIEFGEFIKYMDSIYVVSENNLDEVVEAFKIFDLDNNGYISCKEFKNILMKFGGEFTEDEVEQIFRESDLDGDGHIAYAEFVELWKYQ